jgi:DNA-binding NtrC family response regulator
MQENFICEPNDNPNLKRLSVLVIEDDSASLNEIKQALKDVGAEVHTARNTVQASRLLQKEHMHVIIASLYLVDEQCIELIKDYKTKNPDSLFYVLTGREYDAVETSQESVRLIVDDYIRKPLNVSRFACMVETSIGRPRDRSKSLTVVDPLVAKVKPYFLFRSPVMRRTLSHLPQIAASDETVLITGETGTGKEIVARAIHVLSRRSSGPFVPINCGAVPESLIEGDLDEIGDMPINLQVRLLRALEEGKIYRIGGETPLHINVRVIAASNTDLLKAVGDRLFRDDLYYRLNVLRIHLPLLSERVEDIPLLAVHFFERAFDEMGWVKPYPSLSAETIYLLEHYPWKGNVRELRNVTTRVATLLPQDTKRIFPFHILPHLDEAGQIIVPTAEESGKEGVHIPIGTNLKNVEELLISETLKITKGNKTQAAKLLGISLRNLRRKLNK